jgi:predicted site-specific integrase-resolvase
VEAPLHVHGRTIDVVNLAGHDSDDVIADLAAMVSALSPQRYGQRRAKRTTERMAAEVRREEVDGDATRGAARHPRYRPALCRH